MAEEGVTRGRWRERVDVRRKTSVATRLAVGILVVSIITIIATVVISSASVSASSTSSLEVRVDTRAATAQSELEAYFSQLTRGIRFLASSPALANASVEFAVGFRELDAGEVAGLAAAEDDLGDFYNETYLPALSRVRDGRVDPTEFVPSGEQGAVLLQAAYIAQNPFTGLERRLLTDPGDDTAWTATHARVHRSLRDLTDQLGFLDLMLVDPASEAIVYSVNKDVAFATSLTSGPHSGTSLAGLVRRVIDTPVDGDVSFADVAVYPPNLDNPTAFLATPVFTDGSLVAILVGSIPFDEVNRIMTRDWRNGRFGDTGEVYLVGPDRTMRSDARLLVEDPQAYLARIDELGTVTGIDRSRMEALDTSIIFQRVDSESVQLGLSGEAGTVRTTNYLGTDVISAVRPLASDLGWVLVVEQEVGEAEAPLTDYVRSTLVITVVFIVALTFVAVAWSSGFMAPVRAMSASLREIRSGSDTTDVPVDGASEFRALARHLDDMVAALRARQGEVLAAIRSKTSIVRTLMPAAAAERVDLGERHLVDTVPQASVAVLVIDGLDDLATTGDAVAARERLHRLIDHLDDLAELEGLVRVKVKGDAYYAVCGMAEPLIDHAPRATRFASRAMDTVRDLAADFELDLDLRAGVSSGALAAGLVGSTGLVFDVWGDPVEEAFALAHAATPGHVVLSRSARDRMPTSTDLVESTTAHGTVWLQRTARTQGDRP